MRVAAWFSYNGEPFSGFARQNGQLTVQGNIEDALELLFRRRIDTTCAGRTDAGVHALCQVISFDLLPDEWFRRKPDSLLKSLNALTHEEISFRSVRPMPEDFSARFSAVMREYRYYICTDVAAPLLMEKFCWHLGKPLDVEAMKQASTHLLGEHDFKSFCMAVSAKDKPTHRYVADISFKQVHRATHSGVDRSRSAARRRSRARAQALQRARSALLPADCALRALRPPNRACVSRACTRPPC